MNSIVRSAIVVTAITLVLTGCANPMPPGPEPEPEPTNSETPTLSAGVCLDGTTPSVNGGTDADLAAIVDCTEPHLYAVYAVLPLDSVFGPGDSPEEIAETRTALMTEGTILRQTFLNQAVRECRSELADLIGLGDLTLYDGTGARAAALSPAGSFYSDITMTSEEEWIDGDARFVCSLAWIDPADPATQTRVAFDDGVTLADWFTTGMPLETRLCFIYTATDLIGTSCEQPHWIENAFVFNANAVFGEAIVNDMRATAIDAGQALSTETLQMLDETCEEAMSIVLGAERNEGLRMRANLGNPGWYANTTLESYNEIVCSLAAMDSLNYDLVGTVIGTGTEEPSIVPAE